MIKENIKDLILAIAEGDSVAIEDNPEYYDLIQAFGELTGVYALLNTSFNFHGKPIVGSPEDAISTFVNSSMNGLIIGPYFISRK